MELIFSVSILLENIWCYLTKRGWWSLKIHDYPNYEPNDADLEHIADQIKQGMHQGELIQEDDD